MQRRETQVLDVSDLNETQVLDLLDRSLDGTHELMDDDTFCVVDIQPYGAGPFNALIIQNDGEIYRSPLTSNHLIELFAESLNNSHDATCQAASVLGYQKKIPYVLGERGLMPLEGYTKKTTTWITLNLARRHQFDKEHNLVHLISSKNVVLTFAMSKAQFEKQLLRTAEILQFKLVLHKGRMKEYRHAYWMPEFLPPNILSHQVEILDFTQPPYTSFEAEEMVRLHNEKKRLKEILGEGNPYYEEYLALLETV